MTSQGKPKAAFLSHLATREAEVEGYERLTHPLLYRSPRLRKIHTVEAGFPTDRASFALGPLSLRGRIDKAAVLHDDLYALGGRSRRQCDLIFHEAMGACDVAWWERELAYLAVRLCGWVPWSEHRRGHTLGRTFHDLHPARA